MSLRSEGYIPKMVKEDSGSSYEVCAGIAEARGKLTDAAGEILDYVSTYGGGEFFSSIFSKVSSANALLGITETISIPSIMEAGFTARKRRDFWGNIIP